MFVSVMCLLLQVLVHSVGVPEFGYLANIEGHWIISSC